MSVWNKQRQTEIYISIIRDNLFPSIWELRTFSLKPGLWADDLYQNHVVCGLGLIFSKKEIKNLCGWEDIYGSGKCTFLFGGAHHIVSKPAFLALFYLMPVTILLS